MMVFKFMVWWTMLAHKMLNIDLAIFIALSGDILHDLV